MIWGKKKPELNYTAIHYEFQNGETFQSIRSRLPNASLYDRESKTHYIRAEYLLRGLARSESHSKSASKVISADPNLEHGFDIVSTVSGIASRAFASGNAGSVIRAKSPSDLSRATINDPYFPPAPVDLIFYVIEPIPVLNADGSSDVIPTGVVRGDIKAYGPNQGDHRLYDWFVRFNGVPGSGPGGFVWMDDAHVMLHLSLGQAVLIGCGIDGLLTHILGTELPATFRSLEGVKKTETLQIEKTSSSTLEQLDHLFVENCQEDVPGRAAGWLSWIYHPQSGTFQDEKRYIYYFSKSRFGG